MTIKAPVSASTSSEEVENHRKGNFGLIVEGKGSMCASCESHAFEMGRNDQLASVYREQQPLAQFTP